MDEQLSIRIESDKDKYIATTYHFPGCIGIGKNEEDALKELGKSVVSFMEKNINNVIKLIENPKLIRVKSRDLAFERLRVLDRIFFTLGLSRKARRDMLKIFADLNLKMPVDASMPFKISEGMPKVIPNPIPGDPYNFIINMSLNLN